MRFHREDRGSNPSGHENFFLTARQCSCPALAAAALDTSALAAAAAAPDTPAPAAAALTAAEAALAAAALATTSSPASGPVVTKPASTHTAATRAAAALAVATHAAAAIDASSNAMCTPVCGERFSHLLMTSTAPGYKNVWVCVDREVCMARVLAGPPGGGSRRASKVARR